MDNLNINQIEKKNIEIQNIIVTNIMKMLTERSLFDKNKYDEYINKLLNTRKTDDTIYTIKSDNNVNYAIKLLLQKVTAINKTIGIIDFFNNYRNHYKIIVVKEISKKAQQYITTNFDNVEIFLEEELLINLIDHILVPKHEILSKEQTEEYLKNYTKKDTPKIMIDDPVARYYNMKKGDICRIIRPSDTSGFTITYRIVK